MTFRTTESFCEICPNRFDQPPPLSRRAFLFPPATEAIVRDMLADLAAPPVLVFPGWDAVEDGSRLFRVYCDASIDGFGATFEQGQPPTAP